MEPRGSVDHPWGTDPDAPFGAPSIQDLKHVRIPTRWSDELLGDRWGLDTGGQAPKEDTRLAETNR